MSIKLPRLPFNWNDQADLFRRYWDKAMTLIEAQEGSQDTLIADLNAVVSRLKRISSHTVPTTILHATDVGATATVTIDDHVRLYGDGTSLNITGSVITGLASNNPYAFYYDDVTLANTTPTFVPTIYLKTAQTIVADGRHFLGVITTPVGGSGKTVDGGGVYAAGSNIGGELV